MDSLHWKVIHNDSLESYLISNKTAILESSLKIREIDKSYGKYLCKHILTPDMESESLKKEKVLYNILSKFYYLNDDYYTTNFEIHIKDSESPSTVIHMDRFTWMISDKNIVNQAWVLLYNDSSNNSKNLDLYDNPNMLLWKRCDNHGLGVNGYENFCPPKVYDGSTTKIGDIIYFQNGIIHGTNKLTDTSEINSTRISLAITYYKRDWILTNTLTSFYHNFWSNDNSIFKKISESSLKDFANHTYSKKIFGFGEFITIKSIDLNTIKKQDDEWYETLSNEIQNIIF